MVSAHLQFGLDDLEHTFAELAALSVYSLDLRRAGEGATRAILGFAGAPAERLRDALERDPTVSTPTILTTSGDRTLVGVDLDPEASLASVYAQLVELDGSVQSVSATEGSWDFELFFPDRKALSTFYERCREANPDVVCRAVSISNDFPTEPTYGTTEPQRETLRTALELGYFDVPKRTSLVEVADDLGLSDQAVSERLRRGTASLVRSCLVDERADSAPSAGQPQE